MKLWIGLGAVVVVAAVAGGWWYYTDHHTKQPTYSADTVAVVGRHVIKTADIKDYLGEGLNKQDVLGCMMEDDLYTDLGAKIGVSVSQADAIAKVSADTGQPLPYHAAFLTICAHRDLLQTALRRAYTGSRSGTIIMVNFSQSRPENIGGKLAPLTASEQARMTSDQEAAQALITQLHSQVQSGALTVEAAATAEEKNGRFGMAALPNLPHSGSFDTSDLSLVQSQLIAHDSDIQKLIDGLKANQISPVMAQSTPANNDGSGQKIAVRYYFVVVHSILAARGGSFNDAVAAQKQLGYKAVQS